MAMSDLPRNDSTQAMKSILSAYGEDEIIDDLERPDISGSEDEEQRPASQPVVEKLAFAPVDDVSSTEGTPGSKHKVPGTGQRRAMPTKLVSYQAEGENDSDEYEDEEEDMDAEMTTPASVMKLVDYNESITEPQFTEDVVKATHNENIGSPRIELPPEPTTKCSNRLQEKILNMYKKRGDMDLNASIQNRKDFRNPSIYEKLVTYLNIDEKGTNYPPELYNHSIWGKESYYDELAKAQKAEMDKREKEKKEKTKVEFVTGTKKQTPDGTVIEQKRKSKWDSQPPSSLVSKPVVITTTVVNPPVISTTTSSSGNKTVISAIGTLKKPK